MVRIRKGTKTKIKSKPKTTKKVNKTSLALNALVNDLEVGESVFCEHVEIFPVFRNTLKQTKLKTLAEALKDGIVKVKETGTVSEIDITNTCKNTKILILEGDIIKGGAQDRIINTSLILEEDSTIKIPTTCVQQQRWDDFQAPFKEVGVSSPQLSKSLKESVTANLMSEPKGNRGMSAYASNQGEIWGKVNHCLMAADVNSKTSNYNDIHKNREEDIKKYRKAFEGKFPPKDESLIGAIMIVGDLCKIDLCADNELFMNHCFNLLEGCFIDAISATSQKELDLQDICEALEELKSAKQKECATPNKTGTNLVLKGKRVNGNALLYKNEVIHLTGFIE